MPRKQLAILIFMLFPLWLHADVDTKQQVIGIETALPSESIQILSLIKPYQMIKKNGIRYYYGEYEGYPIVLVNTGRGKVSAAAVTANLIKEYHPRFILFFGTAGKLDDSLQVGDIVVASEEYELEHLRALPGKKVDKNPNTGKLDTPLLKPDPELLLQATMIVKTRPYYSDGLVVTTDIFPETAHAMDLALANEAKAIAMEDFSVIRTCQLMGKNA